MINNESVFLCIFALIYALIEIEIEGKDGWANTLPTPKILFHFTQYHVLMNILVILLLFKVYYKNTKDILKCIFIISLWFVLEDTYWFIFNPYYTLKRYNKENIGWHKWCCGLPIGSIISFIIMGVIITIEKNNKFYVKLLKESIIITFFFIIISPLYHTFYNKYHLETNEK